MYRESGIILDYVFWKCSLEMFLHVRECMRVMWNILVKRKNTRCSLISTTVDVFPHELNRIERDRCIKYNGLTNAFNI